MDFHGNFFFEGGGDIVLSIRNERMDSSEALLRVIVMEHGQFSVGYRFYLIKAVINRGDNNRNGVR